VRLIGQIRFTSGGKIVVSGLGVFDEDEFFLNLLNEQNLWGSLLLATDVWQQYLSRQLVFGNIL